MDGLAFYGCKNSFSVGEKKESIVQVQEGWWIKWWGIWGVTSPELWTWKRGRGHEKFGQQERREMNTVAAGRASLLDKTGHLSRTYRVVDNESVRWLFLAVLISWMQAQSRQMIGLICWNRLQKVTNDLGLQDSTISNKTDIIYFLGFLEPMPTSFLPSFVVTASHLPLIS